MDTGEPFVFEALAIQMRSRAFLGVDFYPALQKVADADRYVVSFQGLNPSADDSRDILFGQPVVFHDEGQFVYFEQIAPGQSVDVLQYALADLSTNESFVSTAKVNYLNFGTDDLMWMVDEFSVYHAREGDVTEIETSDAFKTIFLERCSVALEHLCQLHLRDHPIQRRDLH